MYACGLSHMGWRSQVYHAKPPEPSRVDVAKPWTIRVRRAISATPSELSRECDAEWATSSESSQVDEAETSMLSREYDAEWATLSESSQVDEAKTSMLSRECDAE